MWQKAEGSFYITINLYPRGKAKHFVDAQNINDIKYHLIAIHDSCNAYIMNEYIQTRKAVL